MLEPFVNSEEWENGPMVLCHTLYFYPWSLHTYKAVARIILGEGGG